MAQQAERQAKGGAGRKGKGHGNATVPKTMDDVKTFLQSKEGNTFF